MKQIFLFITSLCFAQIVNSQQLTTNEVIEYLNSLTDRYPIYNSNDSTRTYYNFEIVDNPLSKYIYSIIFIETPKERGAIKYAYDTTIIDLDRFEIKPINIERGRITCYSSLTIYSVANPFLYDKKYKKRICELRTPCFQSSILDIYSSGILYIVSLLSEKKESLQVHNPFITSKNTATNLMINLSKQGSLYTLIGSINNNDVNFIFDSGASDCSLNESTFKKLFQSTDNSKYIRLTDGLYKMADGSIVRQPRYEINGITFDNQLISNIKITVFPDGSPNLLGNSFLSKFSSWSLDQKSNTLTLKW